MCQATETAAKGYASHRRACTSSSSVQKPLPPAYHFCFLLGLFVVAQAQESREFGVVSATVSLPQLR